MTARSFHARLTQLEQQAKRLERQHAVRYRHAVTAIERGTARYQDFKVVYPAQRAALEKLLEQERVKLDQFPFDPPKDHRMMNLGRAFLVIIGRTPDELPTKALFQFRPFMGRRGLRRGHWQWDDYVQANLLLVHLERWEQVNDPTRSGQNRSRADILADRRDTYALRHVP